MEQEKTRKVKDIPKEELKEAVLNVLKKAIMYYKAKPTESELAGDAEQMMEELTVLYPNLDVDMLDAYTMRGHYGSTQDKFGYYCVGNIMKCMPSQESMKLERLGTERYWDAPPEPEKRMTAKQLLKYVRDVEQRKQIYPLSWEINDMDDKLYYFGWKLSPEGRKMVSEEAKLNLYEYFERKNWINPDDKVSFSHRPEKRKDVIEAVEKTNANEPQAKAVFNDECRRLRMQEYIKYLAMPENRPQLIKLYTILTHLDKDE